MSSLVFDIETSGQNFSELDPISQEYMLKYAEDEEEEASIKDQLSFYPLTGSVVAIGMLNPETDQGMVLMQEKKGIEIPELLEEGITAWSGSEKEMLEKFWELAKKYSRFITYNGRGFDVPFLMIRSAILGVTPSKNLLSNRYLSLQRKEALHIDLCDQLSFYGASRKKFTLHMWTKAFGIASPKEDGVDGEDVTRLFNEGKLEDIARYNVRDIKATAQLYDYWDKYLNL